MSGQQFYERYYAQVDDAARQWRELGGAIKAQNIVALTAGLAVHTVLDIGSGTGAVLAHLDRIGFGERYCAIDIANTSVQAIQQRADIRRLADVRLFDGSTIPYGDQAFDLAILSHVVEHIADPAPLICEAARVARMVVIEVPLEDNLHIHLKTELLRSPYREQIGHIQWFNRRSFRDLLERRCGLAVKRMQMVYLPDQVYYFRKRASQRLLVATQVAVRRALRRLAPALYERLLTDHCIALVWAAV